MGLISLRSLSFASSATQGTRRTKLPQSPLAHDKRLSTQLSSGKQQAGMLALTSILLHARLSAWGRRFWLGQSQELRPVETIGYSVTWLHRNSAKTTQTAYKYLQHVEAPRSLVDSRCHSQIFTNTPIASAALHFTAAQHFTTMAAANDSMEGTTTATISITTTTVSGQNTAGAPTPVAYRAEDASGGANRGGCWAASCYGRQAVQSPRQAGSVLG